MGSGVCAPGDRFKNYNIIGSEACSDESELRDKVFGEEPEDADELARIERYERVQATMKDIFLLDAYSSE